MYTPGIKIVEDYSKGNPHERFKLIYKNYRVFTKLVDSYEVGVYNSIICEKEYNRRQKMCGAEELGVRVMTGGCSDRVAREAIEHISIQQAIREGNYVDDLLQDTDEPEKHKRDILTIRMMRYEFEVFEMHLKALPPRERRITYKYLCKEVKADQLAAEEEMADQTLRNILSRTRKCLEKDMLPFFRESI